MYRMYHVEQDGGLFFLYEDTGLTRPIGEPVSAPMRVDDFDLEAAEVAREWFERKCRTERIIPVYA